MSRPLHAYLARAACYGLPALLVGCLYYGAVRGSVRFEPRLLVDALRMGLLAGTCGLALQLRLSRWPVQLLTVPLMVAAWYLPALWWAGWDLGWPRAVMAGELLLSDGRFWLAGLPLCLALEGFGKNSSFYGLFALALYFPSFHAWRAPAILGLEAYTSTFGPLLLMVGAGLGVSLQLGGLLAERLIPLRQTATARTPHGGLLFLLFLPQFVNGFTSRRPDGDGLFAGVAVSLLLLASWQLLFPQPSREAGQSSPPPA